MRRPISELDIYLFKQGTHYRAYEFLGAHVEYDDDIRGIRFAVWAPNAHSVYLIGDFNKWSTNADFSMSQVDDSGIWTIFKTDVNLDYKYKFEIHSKNGKILKKSDPYAFGSELRPNNASVVTDLSGYIWNDEIWKACKIQRRNKPYPINIYEVNLASWKKSAHDKWLTFRELAIDLVNYTSKMGYTHIELMPITEYPLDESWGYQTTGYYSVTSRFGHPQDFMFFVDCCHQNNLAVILDWTPGQFCRDEHGLYRFDGEPIYEYPWNWRADNEQWGTASFDHGRPEVQSFLISNAVFWLDVFHVDGLRFDAVSNMLYLNFDKEDMWVANSFGDSKNLESYAFLRKANHIIHQYYPDVITIAEDSTLTEGVTRSIEDGFLGFDYKVNFGWTKDILHYASLDNLYKAEHHYLLNYYLTYSFTENFILAITHDDVVYGKKSLLAKQFGDEWNKFASLRTVICLMMTMPGKKHYFMGGEFGQWEEWCYYEELKWEQAGNKFNKGLMNCVRDINDIYKSNECLWSIERSWEGFEWIEADDKARSIISYIRRSSNSNFVIVIINFKPVVHEFFEIHASNNMVYQEIFNSDDEHYGGSGVKNYKQIRPIRSNTGVYKIKITIPPMAAIVLKPIA